jgi:hypothetical protein
VQLRKTPNARYTTDGPWDLAANRAVEDDPHGEVFRKILETMLGTRSYEQEVARLE